VPFAEKFWILVKWMRYDAATFMSLFWFIYVGLEWMHGWSRLQRCWSCIRSVRVRYVWFCYVFFQISFFWGHLRDWGTNGQYWLDHLLGFWSALGSACSEVEWVT
jgi:hypothetical protein